MLLLSDEVVPPRGAEGVVVMGTVGGGDIGYTETELEVPTALMTSRKSITRVVLMLSIHSKRSARLNDGDS